MDRSLRPGLLLLAMGIGPLLTGCVVGIPGPQPGPGSPDDRRPPVEAPAGDRTACVDSPARLVLERVNGIRVEHGLRGLAAEPRLSDAAMVHTMDQAERGAAGVGHVGSDGSAPGDRLRAAGYRWSMVSENVAAGYASAALVVAGWMDSPGHRATILSPDAAHAGVGYVCEGAGSLRHYWTLVVARPLAASDPPPSSRELS